MIKKILFTHFVAGVVFLFYKLKNSPPPTDQKAKHEVPPGKLSTQLMAYIIVGFMLLFSGIYFALNWLDDRSLITVRVTTAENIVTEYQVKKSALKNRKFTTADGRIIELGDNERLEILPQQ